jgi:predicted site-specific integrase-resolvase
MLRPLRAKKNQVKNIESFFEDEVSQLTDTIAGMLLEKRKQLNKEENISCEQTVAVYKDRMSVICPKSVYNKNNKYVKDQIKAIENQLSALNK